jgi:plasmid stabilization system protein ParE
MNRDLVIRPEAEADLAEAYAWYEQRRQGLGQDLLREVERKLDNLQSLPESFPLVYKDVRRALTKRFPYGIYFLIDNARVVVLAIFHAKRNPKSWQRRV